MAELAKIRKVCGKVIPNSPQETLLVLDATTGQNALEQAQVFHQHTPLTGCVITKLDGSAKGGMAVALWTEMKLPVRYIGTGESLENLALFVPEEFAEALLET